VLATELAPLRRDDSTEALLVLLSSFWKLLDACEDLTDLEACEDLMDCVVSLLAA